MATVWGLRWPDPPAKVEPATGCFPSECYSFLLATRLVIRTYARGIE